MPNAYIFSGLPGVGKTTLAKLLAKKLFDTIYYRVDTIEYYLKKEYPQELTKQGYELVYYQAKENLELGKNIIIDCCDPVAESRQLWHKLSLFNSTKIIDIEVICSDKQIHQNRVMTSFKSNPSKYPNWDKVLARDYQPWNQNIIRIDTAKQTAENSLEKLIYKLQGFNNEK